MNAVLLRTNKIKKEKMKNQGPFVSYRIIHSEKEHEHARRVEETLMMLFSLDESQTKL